MTFERTDPVTHVVSVCPDLTGKPLPGAVRVSLPERHPCPFCLMCDTDDGLAASDGEVTREIIERRGRAIAVPNRWPALTGPAEMLITPDHVSGLEDLAAQDAVDMLLLLDARFRQLANAFPTVAAFFNVGAGSGGSLPHLHAQAVASSKPPGRLLSRCMERRGVDEDIAVAEANGLVLANDHRGVAWVAFAPSSTVEVRIWGVTTKGAASLTAETLRRISNTVCWPYNLLWHGGDQPLVRWLSRTDSGRIYPDLFDTMIVADPHTFHAALQEANGAPGVRR